MGWWETTPGIINGDGPADVMGEAIDNILEQMGLDVPTPGTSETVEGISLEELHAVVITRTVPKRFAAAEEGILEIVDEAWDAIVGEFIEDLERSSTDEERLEVFQFVAGPMFPKR